MTEQLIQKILKLRAETKRRNPLPGDLLETPWPTQLYRKSGGERLGHLPIYYDFDWRAVFGHGRKTFPSGQSLASLTKRECPEDKFPALLLTVRTDVKHAPILTISHFIVIVNINDYLRAVNSFSPDAATTYFARVVGADVTSLAALKAAAATSEGLDILLSLLNVEALGDWASQNPEAMMAVAEVAAKKGFSELLRVLSAEDAARFLDWVVSGNGTAKLSEIVERVREDSLPSLYTLTGITRLRRCLERWKSNCDNHDEEFWQKELSDNSFVLCQLFAQPVVIVKEKAYVGGKRLDNTHGNLVDYLCKNKLTRNFVLIEIKTPCTELLGRQYRGDVINVSQELTGAVLQATNYRYQLTENRRVLTEGEPDPFYSFDPHCVVIIGHSSELTSPDEVKAFEHFRNGLSHVTIITYDEMYEKVHSLLTLLEGEPAEYSEGHSAPLPG